MGCATSLIIGEIEAIEGRFFALEEIKWYKHDDLPNVVFTKLEFLLVPLPSDFNKSFFTISYKATNMTVKFGKNGKTIKLGEYSFFSTFDQIFVFVEDKDVLPEERHLELYFHSLFEVGVHHTSTDVIRRKKAKDYKKPNETFTFQDPFNLDYRKPFIVFNPDVPNFRGKKVFGGSPRTSASIIKELKQTQLNGAVAGYQYATTQRPLGEIDPMVTVYVKDDNDIILAIDWATRYGYGIAVRSGGHQYCGASSGNSNIIQLDLSGRIESYNATPEKPTTYQYSHFSYDENWHDKSWHEGKRKGLITCGVGLSLYKFQTHCLKEKLFLPTGMCWDIYLGGHCQTGGIGSMVSPFGLFIDYIWAIRIVLPKKLKQFKYKRIGWIKRNTTDPLLADIFFSTLGGSPGNFGVITHLKITPRQDKDHPNAHGCMISWLYKEEAYNNLIKHLDEMMNGKEWPEDFDCAIFVLGGSPFFTARQWLEKWENKWTIDSAFASYQPELYSQKLYTPEEPEINPTDIILFTGIWSNLQGEGQKYTSKESQHFQKFVDAVESVPGAMRIPDELGEKCGWGLFDSIDPSTQPMPISEMWYKWSVRKPRVYHYHIKDSASILSFDYVSTGKWTSQVADAVNQYFPTGKNSQTCGLVLNPTGGKKSKYHIYDKLTSYSWREHGALVVDMAVYWDINLTDVNTVEKNFPECFYLDEWKQRMIWAPSFHHKDERSLDKNWSQFFDSWEKYKRIYDTKYNVDPGRIFTPNKYCVGYYPLPKHNCPAEDEKKMSSDDVQDELKNLSTLTNKTEISRHGHDGDRRSAPSEMETTLVRAIDLKPAVNPDEQTVI